MIHSTSRSLRNLSIAFAFVADASCRATISVAQSLPVAPAAHPAPSTTDTIRLTDEQRLAILDGNTEESVAAARGELLSSGTAERGIHGEVGIAIGSHGTRDVYGAAEIPLGEDADAAVSFESSRFGYRR